MKTTTLDSKPEQPLSNDSSRVRMGRLASVTPSPVSCLTFTYCVSSEYHNESVNAIACTTASCTSINQCNQQYSIYALTDSLGNVSERYAYTAYGQPTFLNASATVQTSSAANNRYTYTAREWDQTIGLHHFRARWMSGLCGRFLGRDPIGYDGGESVYILNINFDRVDSRGTLDEVAGVDTVDIDDVTRRSEKDNDSSCGLPKIRRWNFRAKRKLDKKTEKPCNGYIIQEVTVKCERSKCSPGGECGAEKESDSFKYYEAWYVGRSAKPESDVGYTDEAFLPLDSTESCGDYLQEGRVRFFCQSVTGDLGRTRKPNPESGWNTERNFGNNGACPTGAGGLPATKDTPIWWDRGVEVDLKSSSGSAYREFHVKWNCCCLPKSQRKAEVTSLP